MPKPTSLENTRSDTQKTAHKGKNLLNLVNPIRRNLKFVLGKSPVDSWNGAGVPFTQFMNTLSVFFPAGERFFIDSIRLHQDKITDAELRENVRQFIGQEAMHTREHLVYNQALIDAGFPVDKQMAVVESLLDNVKKTLPAHLQLAATMALEHLTASLGDILLKHPELLEGSDPHFKNIWSWHAMEEIEHKGVAFDVWKATVPQNAYSYSVRVSAQVIAHLVFWSLVIPFHLSLVRKSGHLTDIKGWRNCLKNMWGSTGALRKIVPEMIDYFRPGFHPWQYDNRELISGIKELETTAHAIYEEALAS